MPIKAMDCPVKPGNDISQDQVSLNTKFAGENVARRIDCSIIMQEMHIFNTTTCKPFQTISLLNHINQVN